MRRFLTTTLGQIVAIIASSMLATTLLLMALVYLQNMQAGAPWPWASAHRIVSLVDLLQGVPQDKLRKVTLLASAQRPNMQVTVQDGFVACEGSSPEAFVLGVALRSELPHLTGLSVHACDDADLASNIQVLVPIGRHVLEVRTGTLGYHPFRFGSPAFGAALFLFVSVVAMSLWAIWRVIHPLRRLSEKVEQFARDASPAPITEEGPSEIRSVARAFNSMQDRITGLIEARTRMLAAVSHDLRTPLTRMRLQLELPQGIDRQKLRRNIDEMQAMVSSALAFLGGARDSEAREWIDLDALLATLCDEYEATGASIAYEGPGHIRLLCQPNAIQRALGNLIDNAIDHGSMVEVRAWLDAEAIVVEVADDGPGIPDQRLQEVLEPFVRLDSSRRQRNGSIGLGLAIVDETAKAHGGRLVLANRETGGLLARMILPGQPSPASH